MKQLNKLVIILCMAYIVLMCPAVLASDTGYTAIDNFDSLSLTDTAFAKYPSTNLEQTSNVFTQSTNSQKGFKVVDAEGADGKISRVLEVSNTNGDYVILPFSESFVHQDGWVTQFSYDIRFTKPPGEYPVEENRVRTGTAFFRFGNDGFKNNGRNDNFQAPGSGDSITLQKDFWYKIIGKINTTGKLTTYLLDAKTGEILLEKETSKTFAAGSAFNIQAVYLQAYNSVLEDGTKVYITCQIDNAEVVQYDPAIPPELTLIPLENGETDVIRNKELTFNFNQGLAQDSVVALTSENGDEVSCNVSASEFGKLTVSFDGLLERNTTYTLSLAGVKNERGVACAAGDIIFTTEDLHIWNDVEISEVIADGDTTRISFKLSDIYEYPTFSGIIMAATYEEGKMIGLDMVGLTDAVTYSELTENFNIGRISAGTEIQLMLLDGENGPVPLASGKTTVQ